MFKLIKSTRKNFVLILCLLIVLSSIGFIEINAENNNSEDRISVNAGPLILNWNFLTDEAVKNTPTAADIDGDNSHCKWRCGRISSCC
ncbi:MAG: hypothetical protein ACTSP5_12225 [Candidatus Heimdallarchaeota archaeon]